MQRSLQIKQTRLAINGYLDKLEKELITKLQEAGDSAKGQIMDLVATLAENEKEILESKVMSHGVIEVVTSPKQCTSVVKVCSV
jgi:hypothetical protein